MSAYPVGIERASGLDRSVVRAILALAAALIVAASPALVGPAALSKDQAAAGRLSQPGAGGAAVEPAAASPGADVPADWRAAVQEDIRQAEYQVTWQEGTALADLAGAYQAPNRAQNLRTYFTPQGIRIVPRAFEGEAPPWEWGLTLTGYGMADRVQPVEAATLAADGNRIELARSALTEWYINDERGLEQGFTLHSPPAAGRREADATLALEMALSGSLTANLTAAGDALELTTPGGVRVLRYDSLLVTDATGRELPAHFELLSSAGQQPLRVVVDAGDAVYPITVDPLAASPSWTAEGNQINVQFGFSVGTAGDVNGDGYGDVIVGAYLYDNGQGDEGRAFVYHGGAAGLATTAAWTAESDQAAALFGFSVGTAGDVNGDGYADVIVGAYAYDNGQTDEGGAWVYHGGAAGLATTAAWTAESDQAGAQFGYSVGTAGDVNGDGYGDVIVGAYAYDNGQTNEGRAFVYHGGAAGLATTAAWTAESDQAGAQFGISVGTAGDVNGDGYADVIVGSYLYDNGQENEGRAFVYHGGAAGLATTAAWTAESDQAGAEFGFSVGTAGDVNGDGYGDVIVGAYFYDNGQTDEGRAFVYHGGAAGLATTAAWTAESDQANAQFAFSVGTAGDVNGDGYADVIVGAPDYDAGQINEGRAFVYHGGAAGLAATAAWTAESDQFVAAFGRSVGTAGDVNGDGYADVIVGAPDYSAGQSDEGRAWVYHGGAAGLSTTAAWTAESNQFEALFGGSVGTAGDVNGDGYADVIVGARWFTNGQFNEGAAFVYHGGAAGLATTAAWTAESDQGSALFGYSVGTAGDVNGDGYADVIVGAPDYTNGQGSEGRAFVYHGSAAGLAATSAWTAESNQASAQFGYSVGTAGDVNGDGYADVIVGARFYDNGQTDEGAAFVYHGSAAGLSGTAAWTAESDQVSALFGESVGTAGDVNGDGYADVIVGARWYDNGETNEGGAYVYYGNGGDGLEVIARQRRADGSAPVAPGGQVVSPTEGTLAALLRTPFGRSSVALQWEIKPEGTAFDGSGLGQSAWIDSGVAGASLSQLVSGLAFETRYHWRVRIVGRPAGAASNRAVTYRSRWLYGSTFLTALSGQQAIGGTGTTSLLGQAPYVNVTSLGSPALAGLSLRGYPNTEPPNASSIPGYGLGTAILDRYFSLEPNGGADGYTLTLCLNYDDGEVTAAGATESVLQLCRWTGSAWACKPRAAGSDTGANLVCADDVNAFSNWAIASGDPLAVTLASFDAQGQADRVVVTWETVSEINNAGFNLYRGLQADGSDRALLTYVASQAPGSTQGAFYSYEDVAVEVGQTYWYWLEDIDLSGATTLHGPVSATVQAPTAVTLGGLEAAAGGGASFVGLALAAGLATAGGLFWRRRRQEAVTS